MVAEDFLRDPQVQQWLDGVEPAWTVLTLESLQALRREPAAAQTAIQIANDLSVGEIDQQPATYRGRRWPRCAGSLNCQTYNQADAFRFNKDCSSNVGRDGKPEKCCPRLQRLPLSPSHGENRGSSPLGSAKKINGLCS